tara:strand:- start:285 stop:974 length:690 start_codon:yes stop_codon:yes gene_type:complete
MHCSACEETIQNALQNIDNVKSVSIDVASGIAQIGGNPKLKILLSSIEKSGYSAREIDQPNLDMYNKTTPSGWRELRPLFIILSCIFFGAFLLNRSMFIWSNFMMDFMGLFFIVFSLLKLIDYRNFPPAFANYDPLAKKLPIYGWVYPLIELYLGTNYLLSQNIFLSLILTISLLGITTIGVLMKLVQKQPVECACIGTAIKLPLTKATLIENAIMIIMAAWILITILI